ncbi:MAG: calcium/sodium antiporter [Phycisphaerae bacterium]|nr:calcium/sodium antiporter [Phycisphaerae bacterium]
MLGLLLLMCVSLVVLVFGAEALVRGGSSLAVRAGVSSFFVGLTVVAFGTSAPELATGITSTLKGAGDLNVGNVVGASIYNIAVILGVSAVIRPIVINLAAVRVEVRWVLGSACAPMAAWLFDGHLPRWYGALLVVLAGVFVWRAYRAGRKDGGGGSAGSGAGSLIGDDRALPRGRGSSVWAEVGLVVVGLVMLVAGSHLLVDASVKLARLMGLSELVIGLTIVSFGTASPELVTSIVAAFRGKSEIAVGNVLGSNVFNILGILGLTTAMSERTLSAQTLMLDVPMLMCVSATLLPIFHRYSIVTRAEGVFLLALYAGYVLVVLRWAPGWFG